MGLRTTGSIGAALMLLLAPAAHADDVGAPWTLAQARAFATTQQVTGVDESQSDQPQFLVDLRRASVKPLGARVGKNAWLAFSVRAQGFDPDTLLPLRVSFVLHPLSTGYELTSFRGPPPDRAQPEFPIRAAFYYPWYPEAWSRDGGATTFSKFEPSLGLYDSSSRAVAAKHVAAMRYGNVNAGIYSWWGPGSASDRRFATFLSVARQTPFRWAVYYELEGYGDPPVEQLRADLHYLRDTYFSNPAYLKVGGRPVVFVYGEGAQPCGVAARWAQANDVGAYIDLYTPTRFPMGSNELGTITAYSPPLADGISVAAGDLNGDGKAEIVTGGGSTVKVFDGATRELRSEFDAGAAPVNVAIGGGELVTATPSEVAVHGGAARAIDATAPPQIAVGDLNGDGAPELVVAQGEHVEVLNGRTLATISSFDVDGLGGVSVAVGDVDGNGRKEIVVASGAGIEPRFEVVDISGVVRYGPFPAFFPEMQHGLNVAAGDTDGDGTDEIVLGPAAGGSATETWQLANGVAHRVAAFFAWDKVSGTWGTRVAVGDVDGNGVAEVLTGGGPGRPSEVKIFGGYSECAAQPDAWHQYLIPFDGAMPLGRSAYVVMPGFWMAADAEPRLPRDLTRWRADVAAMAASGLPWQLVISFSEWPEGTAVESADEWSSASGFGQYLDALHAVR